MRSARPCAAHAARLDISLDTVRLHARRILSWPELNSGVDAAVLAEPRRVGGEASARR